MARIGETASRWGYQLEHALGETLARFGWRVEAQPVLGTVQPDLIAQSPQGMPVVVEIKATGSPVHFATIAQVAAYGRLAEETRGLGSVRPVLLTTAPLSEGARDAAERLGVMVVAPESDLDDVNRHLHEQGAHDLAAEWAKALERQLGADRAHE